MERLQMCRVCLKVDDCMYVIVNRNMHEVFEKLTNNAFITEDRRPVLVCYFCCYNLKQCCHFQRKCLEAEELFAQMLDEDYKPNPLVNPEVLELNNGFIKSPIVLISIDGVCQTENHAVKEELSANCERLDDIKEPKKELQIDEPEVNLENPDFSLENISAHHSDSEDNVSITEFKTEVIEEEDTNWAPVVKKPKLFVRRTELQDIITEEPKKNEESDSKVIWTTQNRTSQTVPNSKKHLNFTKSRINNTVDNSRNVKNTILYTNFCTIGNKDDIRCTVTNKNKDSDDVTSYRKLSVKEKPYRCEVCHYSCNKKGNLAKHVYTHTGEKPYKCEVCHRCFNNKGNLIRHLRIHTGEKPYKCEMCQYRCNHKAVLTRHIRTHTGEKPYKCEMCQYRCNHKAVLTRHIRTHTGEKPYKCEVCHRSFNDKTNFTRHLRLHTGEKPYICEICQYRCTVKSDLTKHIRRQHTKGNS